MFDAIAERLKDGFGTDDLEWAAKELVKLAADEIPGGSISEKIDWCVEKLLEIIEAVDHLIPVVGAWLDNPLADAAEREGVEAVVSFALRPVFSWANTVTALAPAPAAA